MQKTLTAKPTGHDGLHVKGHFDLDGACICEVDVHYKKWPEPIRDMMAAEFQGEVDAFNNATDLKPALDSFVGFLMGLNNKIEAAQPPAGT